MADGEFWRLAHLSDRQLLAALHGVLRAQRQALAEVIAHLAEVEERRLHLQAACGSLFSYCVQRLGMSEDEACRRIELARLARRFPALFSELASGRIGLSVALLLKPVLSPDNQAELIAVVRGASLQRARELLAAWFPQPDAPARIRKLPERKCEQTAELSSAASNAPQSTLPASAGSAAPRTLAPPPPASSAVQATPAAEQRTLSEVSQPCGAFAAPQPRRLRPIEPLSPGRDRVQLTADASFKRKLEQARDLLRHTYPDGDLARILSRALDLLLEDVMKRRFGARRRTDHGARATPEEAVQDSAVQGGSAVDRAVQDGLVKDGLVERIAARPPEGGQGPASVSKPIAPPPQPAPAPPPTARRIRAAARSAPAPSSAVATEPPETHSPTRPVARAARRAVLERDGLGCSWVDGEGQRCGSTAWLEIDHQQPAGKGGSSEPSNLRWLCRAHNRHAAEHAYGRRHVERAMAARQTASSGARHPAGPVR